MALSDFFVTNPKASIVGVSFIVTLVMTLVTKFFTDQNRMKEIKKGQKEHQKKLKEAKGDMEKQKAIQKEIMESSMELMKHSFKPLLITFIPLIILIWWLKEVFVGTSLESTWIWWYIGVAIISSIALRKIMDVA